jgi:serine/threonine protein kinase
MGNINQLPIGYIIGSHYQIVKVLGQGGFGIVYLVKDLHKLGELLVVKELFAKEFSFRKRESTMVINQSNMVHIFKKIKEDIKKEVTILSKISNPNIVKAYGYFEENETIYSIMEFIEGKDLELFLQEHGPFNENETQELLKQLIHGLKPIHKKNIIHRDIKPNNIIRTPEGIYKIIDFSSNKQYVDGKTTTITSYQNPIYTAPELMQKKTVIGEFSDIYALGMTLIRTLSSDEKMPNITDRFIDDTEFQEAIDTLWIKDAFSNIIHKMVELNYKDRFQRLEEIEILLDNKGDVKNIETTSTTTQDLSQEQDENLNPKKNKIDETNENTTLPIDSKTQNEKKPLGIFSILTLLGILSIVGYTTYPLIVKGFSQYNIFSNKTDKEADSKMIKNIESKASSLPIPSLPTKDELKKDVIENNTTQDVIIKEPIPLCTSENVKLFLNDFIAISESNDLNRILSFYSPQVIRYFNLKNISHKEILADKTKYLKRWKQRSFELLDFSIDDNFIEDGVEYCEITKKTKWKVSSGQNKKSGKSTSKMLLVTTKKGFFQVKSIYTLHTTIDPKPKIKKEPIKVTPKPTPKKPIARTKYPKQDELIITGNKLLLMIKYPKYVKKNERIIVQVKLINTGVVSYLTGGVSISFPGFRNLTIKKLSSNFTTFRKYDSSSKIYHRITHKTFRPKNLLLESTKQTWESNEEHALSFEIVPYQGIHHVQLLIRGALNSSRLVPAQGTIDQQGYPSKSINIQID